MQTTISKQSRFWPPYHKHEAGSNLLLAGPYWLLQLWLNATFEPSLQTSGNVNKEDPMIAARSIEGTRLLLLTPSEYMNLQSSVTKYILMFSKRHTLTSAMAPFAK